MRMTAEELRKLKVGDEVCLSRVSVSVVKVGHKFIHLKNGEKVLIESGYTYHPRYTQWEQPVYRSEQEYNLYQEYVNSLNQARAIIKNFLHKHSNDDVLKVAEFIKNLNKEGA